MVAPTIIAQLEKVQTPPREQNLHDCIDLRLSSNKNRRFIWLGDYHLKGKFSRNTLTKYKIKENLFVVDRFLR